MNKLILIIIGFLTFGCNSTYKSSYNYKCAKQISDKEINLLNSTIFSEYSESDLNELAQITTSVIDSNSDTEIEVFYNERKTDLLVLDIFGLETESRIDETICGLLSVSNLNLPKTTIILFHKYINGFEDGGIIVGLKLLAE